MGTEYNPEQLTDGKRFNSEVTPDWSLLTDEDFERDLSNLERLIDDTKAKLKD